VIIYDEAGDFNKRGSLTRFNAMLNRTFETFRAFQIIVILVMPSFNVLDGDLFDKKIPRLLLHVGARSDNYGHFRAYGLEGMMWIKEKMKKTVVKEYCYANQWPNFYGHFLDLDPARSAELDAFSTKGKLQDLEKSEVKISGLVSMVDIARKTVRSIIWVRKALATLKIKPVRVIKKRNYYPEEILETMSNLIDNSEQRNDKVERRR
jgi:hypothetical protein